MSARLDGEAEPAGADAHLAECGACRDWAERAAVLTRSLRVRAAVATPDLSAAVLAAADDVAPSGTPSPRRAAPGPAGREPAGRRRLALGMVAVAQLTIGMAQLLGVAAAPHPGHADPVATAHLLNESSAWTIALGLGMAWAAFRPAAATGVLVVAAGFLAVLTPFAVADLAGGAATVSRVATHVIPLLGLGLLITVRRGPRRAALVAPSDRSGKPGWNERRRHDPDDDRRVRLRPVSRKSAA